ncbi:MAG: hypothetical protein H8K03_02130 [Nitrospira sp.]
MQTLVMTSLYGLRAKRKGKYGIVAAISFPFALPNGVVLVLSNIGPHSGQ